MFGRAGPPIGMPTSPRARRRFSVLVLGARRRGGRRPRTGLRVRRGDLVDQCEEEIVILDVINLSVGERRQDARRRRRRPQTGLRVRHSDLARHNAAKRSTSSRCAMSARVSGRARGSGWTLGAGCRAGCRGLCRAGFACFRRASRSSFTPRSMAPRARTATATSYLSEAARSAALSVGGRAMVRRVV